MMQLSQSQICPGPVVMSILRQLPQHDRLAHAALVCQSWAAAATAGTINVILASTATPAAVKDMCSWVQQHGRGTVESIQVLKQGNTLKQLTLPSAALAKLAKLRLNNFTVEFDSAGQGSPAVVLPALRLLSLNSCTLSPDTLSVLECPQLTGLQLLYHPSQVSTPVGSEDQLNAALSAILQRLPGLVLLSLGHSHASDAALAQLSCLQQLQDCTLRCPRVTTAVLANLTSSLTSLTLTQGQGVLQEGSLPAAGLPHLKELSVSQRIMQPALLYQLPALERLTLSTCELRADPDQPETNDSNAGGAQLLTTVAQLTNLTSLTLAARVAQGQGVLQEKSLPAVVPHLKELSVSQHAMQPSLLSRLTALEELTLSTCELRADPDTPESNDSNAGGAQLLATAAQLTNLKKLSLTNIMLDPSQTVEGVPQPGTASGQQLSAFSALTASNQLESLTLAYKKAGPPICHDEHEHGSAIQPFPRGAAVWLFPPGRQLTALTELVLDAMDPKLVQQLGADVYYTVEEDPFKETCMSGSDLGLLLAACPSLQRLALNSVLPHRCSELYDFLQDPRGQPQLSSLCLGGLCLTDGEARAVAGITRLRDLELHNSPLLNPEGVAQLVELRQLTRLKVERIGACRSISCCLISHSQTDEPNVWQKLERKLPWMREQHKYWQKYGSAMEEYYSTSDSDSDW